LKNLINIKEKGAVPGWDSFKPGTLKLEGGTLKRGILDTRSVKECSIVLKKTLKYQALPLICWLSSLVKRIFVKRDLDNALESIFSSSNLLLTC
jgi:hypothetical protein